MRSYVILMFFVCAGIFTSQAQSEITGAWQRMIDEETKLVSIVTDQYFAVAQYKDQEFIRTMGGSWESSGPESVKMHIEWDSENPENVGTSGAFSLAHNQGKLVVDGESWTRIDDGTPGALADAWLMTGRKQNGTGEIQVRQIGPRKTMKILSGTRFQWIAYDTEKKTFSGTGGGTYTTIDGKYTENIEFFSRDNSRVGASLPFNYELVTNSWHHSGHSSKGDPMYEVWSRRSELE